MNCSPSCRLRAKGTSIVFITRKRVSAMPPLTASW